MIVTLMLTLMLLNLRCKPSGARSRPSRRSPKVRSGTCTCPGPSTLHQGSGASYRRLCAAVAVSGHSPAQHGVLYLTTSSPRLWHVALHGTFLPPMSGDVGCLKFHNPPTDAALPPHVSGEILRGISRLPEAALGHAHLHVCTLGTQRLRSRAALPA